MLRIPVRGSKIHLNCSIRMNSSSTFIRNTFIEYFVEKHGHKHVRSSSVLPLCDPTVPFVNAGMNQFKGVFLGKVAAPCSRAVNSQKCVRVGGKHNDLDVVGTDGHHHTFFEMLGNWSFGDYYKKEACKMAWDLLLGPYRLKPERLVVTYFAGDAAISLTEDRECRDIWKEIGVQPSRLKALGSSENFWEMGTTGPCGPCTEIHHVNDDGSLTEIWNIVFIQCNRNADGTIEGLRRQHVDTGMGLERMCALLQRVPSNYHTDLFVPIIQAIEKNSKGVSAYGGRFGSEASLDSAYRRLADHARMISVCLADGVFPQTSLNLKQILRRSFKLSSDIFQNPKLLTHLYDEVALTLGTTYPELIAKESEAKLIIEHEQESYAKLRANLVKKWKDLMKQHPEVEALNDVELAGFPLGYREFKQTMSKIKSSTIPGDLVFKLYDTHGFQEDIIDRIATLNNFTIDKEGFAKRLSEHKSRHKTAFKEQQSADKGFMFDKTIEKLVKNGVTSTNDAPKYNYTVVDNKIKFETLKTKLIAILNEDGEWINFLEPCNNKPYYLVTEDTNFYCEEGGQKADSGVIRIDKDVVFKVDSVFKIRDFVFHKGLFNVSQKNDLFIRNDTEVNLIVDGEKRTNLMRNHTALHLLNAAVKEVMPNSVVCQIGSSVSDRGLSLNLSVYGKKLSQEIVSDAQNLVRIAIKSNTRVDMKVVDSIEVPWDVTRLPGEIYPEVGLRLVTVDSPLQSAELCCGTHVPTTGHIEEFCITLVKGAGTNTPVLHALTGDAAKQARELFCRAQKLGEVIELVDHDRGKLEADSIRAQLAVLCGGSGAPTGEYAECLALLDSLVKRAVKKNELALRSLAEREVEEASQECLRQGRRFIVHFVRCSYLMSSESVQQALAASCARAQPTLLLACAGGVICAVCGVPHELMTDHFTAESWLRCVTPVFRARVLPPQAPPSVTHAHAYMSLTKVSLINCEQLVQDAMRVAIKFAQTHTKDASHTNLEDGGGGLPSQDRRHN